MSIIMTDNSREFLEKNVPEVLEAKTARDALDVLETFIERNGFAPPDYEWYNELGREAQKVYDDIYLSN